MLSVKSNPASFFARHAVALHSGLYLLASFLYCGGLALQPSDSPYAEPPAWFQLFILLILFGAPEALALWLFERRKLLRPATQLAGALGLWLCFPLAFWLVVTFGGQVMDAFSEVGIWLCLYLVLGSHGLWFLLTATAQVLCGRFSSFKNKP